MADTKITDLTELTTPGSTDVLPIVDLSGTPTNKKITAANLNASNVVGPASATDGHLAVFDGTTGKLIKDGGAVPGGGSGSVLEVQVFS